MSAFNDYEFKNLQSLTIGYKDIASFESSFNLDSLNGIDSLKDTLKTLKIYNNENSSCDYSALFKLSNLETLVIYNSSFSDLSNVNNLTKLSSLTVSNCLVNSCVPLNGNTSLTYLNLADNLLDSTSYTKDSNGNIVSYNNCQILANLNASAGNGGKLTALYLSGNEYLTDSDYAYVKAYTWSDESDF